MVDAFRSLKKDGFRRVFCLSGHGDALHNRTIDAGVVSGRAETGLDAYVVLSDGLLRRLGLDPGGRTWSSRRRSPRAARSWTCTRGTGRRRSSGASIPTSCARTSCRRCRRPISCPEDLAEWRQGGEHTVRKTPHGYLGDPASADAARGRADLDGESEAIAEAIARTLARRR